MSNELTVRRLMDAGLSKSFAYLVLEGERTVGVPLALWLLDNHKLTVPPLVGKTKREIDVLRGMYEPRAPQSVIDRLARREARA
jgi:hypothetical protein